MTLWFLFVLAIALQALLIVLYQIALKVIDHYTKIDDLNRGYIHRGPSPKFESKTETV